MSFSKPAPQTFRLTPLGAAIVEALPDRRKVALIKKNWRTRSQCPISAAFPTSLSINKFFRDNETRLP